MAGGRRRLGVALVLDPPVAVEVDGLRRAVGDPSLGRIAPHLTLVPPVNVRAGDLPQALAVLRRAAEGAPRSMVLTLGAPATFLPVNPVLYLPIGGDLDALAVLRDRVFDAPLERDLSWPWVPHVTLGDGIPEERIVAAMAALDGYSGLTTVDRLVLLEQGSGRTWEPLADADLGPPARVGTGGLVVEMTSGRLLDPEAAEGAGQPSGAGAAGAGPSVVVTGRREGQVVGWARAWADLSGPHLSVSVVEESRRQGIGSHLLGRLEFLLRAKGWQYRSIAAHGPAGFYRARSRWAVPADDVQ